MRPRNVAALVRLTVLTFCLSNRHHIANLFEVARTYSTFYPFLESHPESLYKYPSELHPPHHLEPNPQPDAVPRIIHQIFLTEDRPSTLTKYIPAISSCQSLHANWTHNLWTDANATTFITQHYPHILPHYSSYKQRIQRANILRYALLHHFGGVYLDLDVTCLTPLDPLLGLPWLTPGAYPAGVNNAFILSRPQHKLLSHLLDAVGERDLTWGLPYVENMLSTGCMFFSNQWMSFVRSPGYKAAVDLPDEDRVYVLADKDGSMDPHMLRGEVTTPLFHHGGASSWHGWDAGMIVMIGKHYVYFLSMVSVGAIFSAAVIWRFYKRKGLGRRASWNVFPPRRRSVEKLGDEEKLLETST